MLRSVLEMLGTVPAPSISIFSFTTTSQFIHGARVFPLMRGMSTDRRYETLHSDIFSSKLLCVRLTAEALWLLNGPGVTQ